jgi:uracil-DNA glycosylase
MCVVNHRLLTPWADRGVLLLNACLTVREHSANSHANQGWEQFTSEVLRAISKSTKGIVFLAWGSPAQKRVDSIGVNKEKHCILRAVHPSPLSASRGFFECKHFIKANEWLRNKYGVEGEVEWDCLADGKQGKDLPPKGASPKNDASVKAVVLAAQVTKTVKGDVHGSEDAVVETTVVARDSKNDAAMSSDEFEDEELDKMLSSEI